MISQTHTTTNRRQHLNQTHNNNKIKRNGLERMRIFNFRTVCSWKMMLSAHKPMGFCSFSHLFYDNWTENRILWTFIAGYSLANGKSSIFP